MTISRVLLALLVVSNSGCVPLAVMAIRSHKTSTRLDELKARLDPLMGASREDVVVAIGPPSQTYEEGGVAVYRYVSLGSTHTYAAGGASEVSAASWQDSDVVEITFRNGVAVSWRANVTR